MDLEQDVMRRKSSHASFKSSSEWGWFVEEDEMAILVEGKEMDYADAQPHCQAHHSPDRVSPGVASWEEPRSQDVLKANHPSYHSSVSSVSFESSKNASFPQGHQSNCNLTSTSTSTSPKDEVYDFDKMKTDPKEAPIESHNEMLIFAGKCVLLAVVVAVFRKYV